MRENYTYMAENPDALEDEAADVAAFYGGDEPLEVCDSCEGSGEDQAPFDYLDYLPQGGPCRFCGGRGSFPVGSYYNSRLARLVVPGDSSWRAELAS